MDWWRYYQAETWGEERADMRAEVQRRRMTDGAGSDLEWEWPYVSEERALESTETAAEFNARMKRKAEEIMRQREQRGL